MLATLRFAISARVVKGELLRLCPSLNRMNTSVEKAKTNCHDAARASQLFGGLKSLEIFPLLAKNRFFRLGVYNAPNSAFRTLGASPTFLIVKLLWLSEGGKGRIV